MFLICLGVFVGLFVIANGLLLLFWPKYFLRFYDFWARGDYAGRTGRWRNNVGSFGYRFFGLGCVAVGLYMTWNFFRIGWF